MEDFRTLVVLRVQRQVLVAVADRLDHEVEDHKESNDDTDLSIFASHHFGHFDRSEAVECAK